MKQTYMKPAMQEMAFQPVQLLEGSPDLTTHNSKGADGSYSRGFDLDFDDEDEE